MLSNGDGVKQFLYDDGEKEIFWHDAGDRLSLFGDGERLFKNDEPLTLLSEQLLSSDAAGPLLKDKWEVNDSNWPGVLTIW